MDADLDIYLLCNSLNFVKSQVDQCFVHKCEIVHVVALNVSIKADFKGVTTAQMFHQMWVCLWLPQMYQLRLISKVLQLRTLLRV